MDVKSSRVSPGFTVLELVLGLMLSGFVAHAVMTYATYADNSKNQLNVASQLSQMRARIFEQLHQDHSWSEIVSRAENKLLLCAGADKSGCLYDQPNPLIIPGADSQPMVNTIDASYGFDRELRPCSNFGTGSQACPFRAEVLWTTFCVASGRCSQIKLQIKFLEDPTLTFSGATAPENFNFQMTKNFEMGSRNPPPAGTRVATFPTPATSATIKVVLIVDNSASMADDRQRIAAQLSSFAETMMGFNVRYLIYTTNSLISGVEAYEVFFNSNLSFPFLIPSATARMDDGATVTGNSALIGFETYDKITMDVKMNRDIAALAGKNLFQSASMTDVTQLKADLNDLIVNIPVGSAQESGMCTLARMLWDDGPHAPFQAGDKALIVMVSDEENVVLDKYNEWYTIGCFDRLEQERVSLSRYVECNPAVETCSKGVNITGGQMYVSETKYVWSTIDSSIMESIINCKDTSPTCSSTTGTFACTSSDLTRPPPVPGAVMTTCYRHNYAPEMSPFQYSFNIAQLSISGSLCTSPFTYQGTSYSGIADYIPEDDTYELKPPYVCTESWVKLDVSGAEYYSTEFRVLGSTLPVTQDNRDPVTGGQDFSVITWQQETRKLYDRIPGRLRELFGSEGYGLFTVVHNQVKDAEVPCTVDPSSGSYGDMYAQLLSRTDTPENLFSICASNYITTKNSLVQSATEVAGNTFTVSPFDSAAEQITEVRVIREGAAIVILPSNYTIRDATVQFDPGLLMTGDSVEVVISPL